MEKKERKNRNKTLLTKRNKPISILKKDDWLYNYQAFWFGSKPQRKKPDRLATADDGTGGTKDVTQTTDCVQAFKSEMFNRFHFFVLFSCYVADNVACWLFLGGSEVLEHYHWNLNAAFIKYIKIGNDTKPLLCIWDSTPHLHENKKDGSFSDFVFLHTWPITPQSTRSSPHNPPLITPDDSLHRLCPLFPFTFINLFTIVHRKNKEC